MNTSLYVLSGEYLAIANKLSDSDIPQEVINDTLEGISGDLEEKCRNVALFVRNLEATAESIKDAEKQMAERRKAIEAKANSIRKYLFDNMKRCGMLKIDSPFFCISIKKNPASVIIDDVSAIPKKFMRKPEPPPAAPDKRAIADAINAGKKVAGARLEQGERLDIR